MLEGLNKAANTKLVNPFFFLCVLPVDVIYLYMYMEYNVEMLVR